MGAGDKRGAIRFAYRTTDGHLTGVEDADEPLAAEKLVAFLGLPLTVAAIDILNRHHSGERRVDFELGHIALGTIESNFLAGRTFSSWEDLNQRAQERCDKGNSTYKKHIRAVPRELFAVERLHLKPLPAWIPEVYRLHQSLVDIEGYIALHTNRYSVPVDWIGRRVEVRETKEKTEIQLDVRRLVTHRRTAASPKPSTNE